MADKDQSRAPFKPKYMNTAMESPGPAAQNLLDPGTSELTEEQKKKLLKAQQDGWASKQLLGVE